MKRTDVIEESYTDSDGFWINLKRGYHVDDCHSIHEETKAKTLARLKDVKPCRCVDCA